MTTHATPDDCPCCHECLSPGEDTDRALVVAFLAGMAARDTMTPLGRALCAKHAPMAADAARFVMAHMPHTTQGGGTPMDG